MNRRHAIAVLLATGSLSSHAVAQGLSEEAVVEMLRALTGMEPRPSEAAQVRAFLLSVRTALPPDPEVEPALTFDPRFPA